MKAVVTPAPGEVPRIMTLPDPTPGAGEVVVRVTAAGLCGTDLKLLDGLIPTVEYPLVQGHEVAGTVVDGAGIVPEGQRVSVYILQACGNCRWCANGETNICPGSTRMGFERPGGLAEYVLAKAENVVAVPDSVSDEMAAVTLDAVLSPWRALHVRGEVAKGDRVLIVGAGGLGLYAVQIAKAAGAEVAVVDPDPGKLEAAAELGAALAVAPEDADSVRSWSTDGADLVLESSGVPEGFRTATELVRAGGVVVTCGYRPGSDVAADSMRLAMQEITIRGSKGGNRDDADGAMTAVAGGAVRPLVAQIGGMEDVPAFLGALRSGGQVGRMVVRP
ncbi:alcohol dehydrogenase catalytic domain-containing protein [Mycolicibacterium sp.]|uniref:alcohol dehydrogenase catalytic domain-containing protein n=1 Tax=Mycolicibacterium sp. TaxID=2320850 RepID=UPI0037C8AF9D